MSTTGLTITGGDALRIAYRPREAAKALGISHAQLYILMARGEIPARKMGKRTLLTVADLRAFVDRQPRAQFTSVHAKATA
jgi:excisionase family DNA binding protein